MSELLPDGTIGGYTNYCSKCNKTIKVNIQGNEIGTHLCILTKPMKTICTGVNQHHKDCPLNGSCQYFKNLLGMVGLSGASIKVIRTYPEIKELKPKFTGIGEKAKCEDYQKILDL